MDFVAIDMEHTTITTDQANASSLVYKPKGLPACPGLYHNNDYVKPLLEAGADGLIIPVVNSGDDAAHQMQLQKFPPIGQRSYGVNRAHGYGSTLMIYPELE